MHDIIFAGLLLASIKIFTVGKMLLLSADHHAGRRLCNLWEHRFSVPDLVYPPRPPLLPGSTILQSRLEHKQILEIRKSQDLAKDLGVTASKAEKKICQSKLWAIYRNVRKLLYLKWKLHEKKKKKKKKRKEKKRREKVLHRFELEPFGAQGESFTTNQRGTRTQSGGIFIIKTFEPY